MKIIFVILFLFCSSFVHSQPSFLINKLELKIDTNLYEWPKDAILDKDIKLLPFSYQKEKEVCEVQVWPVNNAGALKLIHTNDFEIIDSMTYLGNSYRFKIRFNNLSETSFLKFSFESSSDSDSPVSDIPLQAFTQTSASVYIRENTVFIGEEVVFEVNSNKPENLIISNEWETSPQIDYQLSRKDSRIFLHIVPNRLGAIKLNIPLRTKKPNLNNEGQLVYEIAPINLDLLVNSSRLQFLNLTPKEITLSEITKTEGVEIQLDDSRLLKINKTYRIENQEDIGGPLIAELFTKRRLANNKVLCLLRPYNYHSISEGYLYIKEGDDARFLTNLNVSHTTAISKISILRQGGEWKTSKMVYPGEIVDLKINGRGLHNAEFRFEDLIDLTLDTLVRGESQLIYKLKVPIDIRKKVLTIYNHQQPTGQTLSVAEYQKPREFDYLYINYGDIGRRVSGLRGPILYQKIVKDVVFSYNDQLIDSKGQLYGKQYFDMDVRITDKRNQLIEMRSIERIAVCPDNSSPRYEFYSTSDCRTENLSLNKYLSRKTYDLDEWSKISLTLKNSEGKYKEDGYQKEIDIILKKTYSFDIEVSFPAGLITIAKQDDGDIGFGSLSGISMAMIAQFSFYHPEKIASYRPYKIGAGFLAFNAFNFSDNVDNRDVGIVILGSLYPTKRDLKLSFPLYIGGGYFLKDQKWFFPGRPRNQS